MLETLTRDRPHPQGKSEIQAEEEAGPQRNAPPVGFWVILWAGAAGWGWVIAWIVNQT